MLHFSLWQNKSETNAKKICIYIYIYIYIYNYIIDFINFALTLCRIESIWPLLIFGPSAVAGRVL